MDELVKWDEQDAIKVLERMKWPPMRHDGKSTTHLTQNISLDMTIKALTDQWLAKHRLKEEYDGNS